MTFSEFVVSHLKSRWSAESARELAEGASMRRNPPRHNLPTKFSTLSRSLAEVKPHHVGEVYISEARVIIQVKVRVRVNVVIN